MLPKLHVGKELGPRPNSWRRMAQLFFRGGRILDSYLRTPPSANLHGDAAVQVSKMPQSKATKKFERNKLGDVLKKRKDVAKIKQRKQMDAKRKERNARDNALADGVEREPKKSFSNGTKDETFNEMSMDQFFQGGFQVPEMKKKSSKPQTGKRKRTPVGDDASHDSDASMAEDAPATKGDDSDSESGDDAETHKQQLAALAEKDPEFYKYLKHNDAELLDFEEDADLAEIDDLSASEDEQTPRKKRKGGKGAKDDDEEDDEEMITTHNEVSKEMIKKWTSAMEEKKSLRATREVVLAFRAAAHLDDETKEGYKYSISDSTGQ